MFLPPLCACCGNRLLQGERHVCTDCIMQLPRTHLGSSAVDNVFVRRFWGTLPIVSGAAVFVYRPSSELAHAIHTMKYKHRPDLCKFMGTLMATDTLVLKTLNNADVLVPVPITRMRMRERGYNQSELLCQGMKSIMGTPIAHDALKRVRFTDSQTVLTHDERTENVRGAFVLDNVSNLSGKHIVLVDDIVTTGSTTIECLFTLSKIPDVRLSILALAWTGGEW